MPTFEDAAFRREYLALPREQRETFKRVLPAFVAALRGRPPSFPPSLRVKGVQGSAGVYEMSFGDGGRATFEYGDEVTAGEAHVIWAPGR